LASVDDVGCRDGEADTALAGLARSKTRFCRVASFLRRFPAPGAVALVFFVMGTP
jgi:hypothetical protein